MGFGKLSFNYITAPLRFIKNKSKGVLSKLGDYKKKGIELWNSGRKYASKAYDYVDKKMFDGNLNDILANNAGAIGGAIGNLIPVAGGKVIGASIGNAIGSIYKMKKKNGGTYNADSIISSMSPKKTISEGGSYTPNTQTQFYRAWT